MRNIRWGMIGCGDVTEVKSGPALYKAANSSLVAVMRRNGALAADYARRHGVARWSNDAAAIIDAPDIDAVYIATHTDTHLEYCLRVARAGKAVYVEKPMAMSFAQCDSMIAACREARVPLWVAYYRRALPRFTKVKSLLDDGAIGVVRTVTSHVRESLAGTAGSRALDWRVDPALSGGGLFFEGACHTIDFLDYLFGGIVDVGGFSGNQAGGYAGEDVVAASYRFDSGVLGSGIWTYAAGDSYEMNEVVGSKGRLSFSTTLPKPIRIERDGKVEEIPMGDPEHVHQPLIETIVAEMNGRGHCPSTGESAARTARVMDMIMAGNRR